MRLLWRIGIRRLQNHSASGQNQLEAAKGRSHGPAMVIHDTILQGSRGGSSAKRVLHTLCVLTSLPKYRRYAGGGYKLEMISNALHNGLSQDALNPCPCSRPSTPSPFAVSKMDGCRTLPENVPGRYHMDGCAAGPSPVHATAPRGNGIRRSARVSLVHSTDRYY